MPVVLDASALLAYWLDEPGAEVVAAAIGSEGAVIAAPNFAEALTKLIDRRTAMAKELGGPLPLAGGSIEVEPFTLVDAEMCAKLRVATKQHGLSLGDRACLALGQRMGLRVLTADRAWSALRVGVDVTVIR